MEKLPKKVRSKKRDLRVDLTAMVSVSFLLIIFFMVVGELAKPKLMSLSLPDKGPDYEGVISCGFGSDRRVITVLLDENDKIISYAGLLGFDEPKILNYGNEGIRKELIEKQAQILQRSAERGKPGRGAIVIIKPSKKSNFKNLIDILDEMAIVNIDTYTIVDYFTPEEIKLLASK